MLDSNTDNQQEYAEALGSNFSMHVAFSRDQAKKIYVQQRLKEASKEVNELLEKQRAYFYVCGDAANMAREVNTVLAQVIAQERGVPEAKGEEVVKQMRASGQYQEDVWS
jgi:NADPH-ferrihemoprotein reductase